MKIPLKIKGQRNYIQGGDFFDGINFLLHDENILELSFRNFTLCECNLEQVKNENTIANLHTNKGKYYINKTDNLVVKRVEYKEELIVSDAYLDNLTISSNCFVTGFTTMEHIIALTKLLNNELDPLEKGKWVFAQLKLKAEIPSLFKSISISSEQRIVNKFSKNKIIIDNQDVGFINFIVGEP